MRRSRDSRSGAVLVRPAPGSAREPRIPCVIETIDTTTQRMSWRRVRYRTTPPVVGDYEIYGATEIGYPQETKTAYDYALSTASPAFARRRGGVYLLEPTHTVQRQTTALFGVFVQYGTSGVLAELDPDTLKPITGRRVHTPNTDPRGCGGGKNYLWSATTSELFEYSTATMGLLRRFLIWQGSDKPVPKLAGVDLLATSVGGTDDLIYLFGLDRNSNKRLFFILDVTGPDRTISVRSGYPIETYTIIPSGTPQSAYYGGGDETYLFVGDGGGRIYTLNASSFALVASRNVGGTLGGFGGNFKRCFLVNKDTAAPEIVQERDPTTLSLVRTTIAAFQIPQGIGGDPD